MRPLAPWLALAGVALLAPALAAQEVKKDTVLPPLFASVKPLDVTFTANLRRLRSDKDTNAPWRTATLSYAGDAGPVVIPARAKTRGIWRLAHCAFPPLRLDFPAKEAKSTLFAHLGKPKLVNYCRDDDAGNQYILQELQLYRVYQLLTPVSYRTRLLRMAYVDSAKGDTVTRRYAFIAEDPEGLAKRLGGLVVKTKGATADDLAPEPLAVAYVFQYMIGNTDFSFSARHNLEFVSKDGTIYPIIFDYDQAGVINTAYSTPDPSLGLRRVTERLYRGLCVPPDTMKAVIADLKAKRNDVEAIYRDDISKLMGGMMIASATRYLNQFYSDIENPRNVQRDIIDRCAQAR